MRASKASAGARRRSVMVDVSASVKHEAPEKGEPEKYPSAGARPRWCDDDGDDEFTPLQNYGAGRKQRPALPQAMEESRWVRAASSCANRWGPDEGSWRRTGTWSPRLEPQCCTGGWSPEEGS